MPKKVKNDRKLKIEKQLKDLETTVQDFEQGKFGLDDGIEEYKKAVKLIGTIKKELNEVELKIEDIKGSN